MNSLDNITWERLENQNAVTYPSLSPEDPGQAIVFADGFPRADGRARFTPASIIAPAMILTTGRQLEHWHTGSMTRRATVLDGLEPEANCSLHPSTLRKLGIEAGDLVRHQPCGRSLRQNPRIQVLGGEGRSGARSGCCGIDL